MTDEVDLHRQQRLSPLAGHSKLYSDRQGLKDAARMQISDGDGRD
jgi:hypothetical protein